MKIIEDENKKLREELATLRHQKFLNSNTRGDLLVKEDKFSDQIHQED